MFPTIHKGDLIKIEPAASLRVGDVVVFRSGDALVCHRVTGVLSSQEILTRGDGSTEADEKELATLDKQTREVEYKSARGQ